MPWTWIEQMCLSTIGGWGSLSRQPRTWTESACESTATTHTQTAACESYRWFSPYFHWFLIEFPCKNSYAVALMVWHSRAGGVWRKWDERSFASCDFSHAHWQTEAQNRSAKPKRKTNTLSPTAIVHDYLRRLWSWPTSWWQRPWFHFTSFTVTNVYKCSQYSEV